MLTVTSEDWQQFVQQEWTQHKAASFSHLKYKDAILSRTYKFKSYLWRYSSSDCPCSHIRLKLLYATTLLDLFCADIGGELTVVHPAYRLRTCSSHNRRTSKAPGPLIISKNHFLYAKPLCATFIALDLILRTICHMSSIIWTQHLAGYSPTAYIVFKTTS